MPTYSVKLRDKQPPVKQWEHIYHEFTARTAKAAIKKAEDEFEGGRGPKRYVAVSARQVRHERDRRKWRKIWYRALRNMPARIMVQKQTEYVEQPKDSVPVPVFIKERAHGRMKRDDDTGLIYKLETKRRVHKQGQLAVLTRLLGYSSGEHRHSMAHMTVLQNITRGAIPKDEKRRDLLLKLAGKDGTKLALHLSGLRFEPLKIRKV